MIVRPQNPNSVATLLFALKGSVVPIIWPRVLYTMVLSVAVVLADRQGLVARFTLEAAPLTLLGLTLAIFLGFRNNVAYQRWWEGRILWGELVVVTRNLARQVRSFMPTLEQAEQSRLIYLVIGFTHALRHHLRGTEPDKDLRHWLPKEAFDEAMASPNKPNIVLGYIGKQYVESARSVGLDSMFTASMDVEMSKLSHVLGGCERIKNTPIPFAYILLLHRTVHVYCFMLPFYLIGSMGWLTPLAVGIIAYTFFGLDEIGGQIEDPFDLLDNDLPLDTLCRSIEISLKDLLNEKGLPSPIMPKNSVLS